MVRAIGTSLGPHGRSVLVCRHPEPPAALVKGSEIARAMPVADGPGGIAPRMLREMLHAFDRDHQDGTSRLALSAGACLSALVREEMAGSSMPQLAEALTEITADAAEMLAGFRVPADLRQVAIASGIGEGIAADLASRAQKLGPGASFDIVEGQDPGLSVTSADGFAFDIRPIGGEALPALSNVSVLVADEVIRDFGPLANVLEGFASRRKALVIACRGMEGAALATLNANQKANVVTVAAMQPTEAGPQASDLLEDLAIATGATLVAERFGVSLARLKPAMLGRAESARIDKGRATLISPQGRAEAVEQRRRYLAAQADKAKYLSYDRERFERRGARLAGRWCQLSLRGATPQDTALLIERTRAATAGLMSALRHGAVAGGGAAFGELAAWAAKAMGTGERAAAARCLAHALRATGRQLEANRGGEAQGAFLPEPVLDPFGLMKAILDQSVGFSAALLRTGAVVAR